MSSNTEYLEAALQGALECLIWSETAFDEEGEEVGPYDDMYQWDNATPELQAAIMADLHTAPSDLVTAYRALGYEPAQFGHDMTLTRNGHGAGYWDRGIGQLGDDLSDWARHLGELHVFDDFIPERAEEWEGMYHAE